MRTLLYILWFLGPVLESAIIFFMVRRKVAQQYPWFFNYMVLQVLTFAVLATVYHVAPGSYFASYWTLEALSAGMGLGVLYEIFSQAFRPYRALHDLGSVLYKWLAVLLVFMSAFMALAGSGMEQNNVVAFITLLDRVVRIVQCGLLFFVLFLGSRLGLSWGHYIVGLGLGFMTFASVELTLLTIRSQIGNFADSTLSLIKSGAYNAALLIWLGYVSIPKTAARRPPAEPQPDRWDYALLMLLNPDRPVFIAQTMETVERVMRSTQAKA